jgi:4-hydroxy-tetrahydrodipicolinate synthase
VPSARDARDWARSGGLRGIGDSLYTPFRGRDGDDIDYAAYRALVRYCVGDLGHPMLWLTSGIAEWWSLTTDERKRLLEVAVEEARAINPAVVIQACTAAGSAKEAVELTRHAQEAGADIAYLQTPPMELHGGEGTLRFFRYVADRTDLALGVFNSPSSGYVLTPQEVARIAEEVPAVCATKEGAFRPYASKALHALAPELVIWECDLIVYRAGWLQEGIVTAAQLGTCGYLYETPGNMRYTRWFELIEAGELGEAIRFAADSGIDRFGQDLGTWFTSYPGRPDYFTHWGAAFRHAAAVMGLPMGDHAESRPPQALLPQEARDQIRRAVENAGFARDLVPAA